MKVNDFIVKYGEATYVRQKELRRAWDKAHPGRKKKANYEQGHKDGEYYQKTLKYRASGVNGKRNKIRGNHRHAWSEFKKIIAPGSQLHHQWLPGTAEYSGVALVEADMHLHGIIDVIRILEGKITLFTEEEIKGQSDKIKWQ